MSYDRVDDDGLHVTVTVGDDGATERRTYAVDTVVLCAGQESVRALGDELRARGVTTHLVGGADVAAEVDAKRAIRQATEVAAAI